MAGRSRHHWSYWLGAAMTALIVGFAACYAGVEAYNREIERERLQMGASHFIDGRMPLELPLYAAIGAFVGWWAFCLLVHYARRAHPSGE